MVKENQTDIAFTRNAKTDHQNQDSPATLPRAETQLIQQPKSKLPLSFLTTFATLAKMTGALHFVYISFMLFLPF
jgi:hypothetical protein